MKAYRITVTEKQLKLIETALEWFFRLQMGQFFDYCNEVAFEGYDYGDKSPENRMDFDERIDRRNRGQEAFDAAWRVLSPPYIQRHKTLEMRNAIDMWHDIRHFFWKQIPEPKDHWVTASSPCSSVGEEPRIVIEDVSNRDELEPKGTRSGAGNRVKGTRRRKQNERNLYQGLG